RRREGILSFPPGRAGREQAAMEAALRDPGSEAREEMLAKMEVSIEFLVMNCEEMKFPGNSFDVIFGNSILHHLDLEKTFTEMRRVLRPGGICLFTEPLGHNLLINTYRRLTPHLRTEDEHPFMHSDIELMERSYDSLRKDFYHLSTFAAVPFGRTSLFEPLRNILHSVDQSLFQVFPFLRHHAWMALLEAKVN
ncbi:MAG: class I SAM-dependent methyltransferase, partial [Verrucomicrobiaceae bacterium]|nr:class I SAM-dependent methyltransferase [Verrucomicrobiaceae bacterium]